MKNSFKRRSARLVNLAIAIGAVLLVVVWHTIASVGKAHLQNIAAELVSTIEFFGAPHPNHAGTKLFYAQTSTNGIIGYIVDIASGQKTFLFEHDQSHLQGVGLLGWSPDDKLFSYSVRSPRGQIIICDGNSAGAIATVSENKIIKEGTWLSSEAFVYVNENQDLSLIQRTDTEWHKSSLFAKTPTNEQNQPANASNAKPAKKKKPASRSSPIEPVRCLTAISANSVAWQQGGTIWRYELGSDAPVKVWESETNSLQNFCFSSKQNTFTLHYKNAGGEFLSDLHPAFIWGDEQVTNFEQINLISDSKATEIGDLVFMRDGLGYAYFARSQNFDAIVIKSASNSIPVQLAWKAGVDSFGANDTHVYIAGSPTNGPLDIWDYDVKSGSLSRVVSGYEHPFKYAKTVIAAYETATNANGETIPFHLSPPASFVTGHKYPLVITFNGVRWRPQEASVPNAGCFLASCNGIPSNEADVIAVYQAATQNPDIDVKRVYVMGVSAGAGLAGQLLQDGPDLWRGAILLSPVSFPDVSQLKAQRILIDSGGNDAYLKQSGGIGNLTQFQEAAALAGIPVTLSINGRASHVYRSNIAEQERITQILEFLSGY